MVVENCDGGVEESVACFGADLGVRGAEEDVEFVIALGIGAAAGVGDGEVARGPLSAALVTKMAFRKAVK